ncbi:DUF1009 domain-containing protein [Marinicauda salina]|uniref:DUF1009 domain-containing protein n=1 Tax=Marinicauda salina TaxID=2135793 RepID=A0A2U2BTB3_9PROT|nr:UDP-2,3-diacylglucosamine diphosphatase LpxI [Marinicauda salina]PWE17236.1 DUF1009 domain-containing protein [Marinicauda salina]
MTAWRRLGLIAGAGELPERVAEACAAEGRLGCVIALSGFADPARFASPLERGLGQFGQIIRDLNEAECDAVCFAGIVTRPDFSQLKPDWEGARLLPKVLAAAARGDDALLRAILGAFEHAGFTVVGADEVADALLARPGLLGGVEPSDGARADALKAMRIAGVIGAEDIGQGAVVGDGLVLAVEAQEGTDSMLERVAGLPDALRGGPDARRGVLAKRPKPGQETRVDLPVIGVSTVERAAAAGLAGIAAPEGEALILGRDSVARAAEDAGLFVWVLTESELADAERAP